MILRPIPIELPMQDKPAASGDAGLSSAVKVWEWVSSFNMQGWIEGIFCAQAYLILQVLPGRKTRSTGLAPFLWDMSATWYLTRWGAKWKLAANLQVIEDSQPVEESQPLEEVFPETQAWPLIDLKPCCNKLDKKLHCKRNNLTKVEWAPPWARTSYIGDGTGFGLNLDHFCW